MPPSLPSVPVVLANSMRVTPVQGNVYMLGGAGGDIALQVGRVIGNRANVRREIPCTGSVVTVLARPLVPLDSVVHAA
jgi:hypothetical protein